MEAEPPFEETYKTLLFNNNNKKKKEEDFSHVEKVEERELPVIDMKSKHWRREIVKGAKEWGFFQVVNHGISSELLGKLRGEQVKVFRQPFDKKVKEKLLNFSADSYRWGTPNATRLNQFSWSEAFHIPLTHNINIPAASSESTHSHHFNTLWSSIYEFASNASTLARTIAEILAEYLGQKCTFFEETCKQNTCYLRLNRYPPCSISSEVFGLMPHTDSDFLTILYQDQVGGLQLVKDGRWIMVKPNPQALIVNIGDLFQAWSNDVYKSVEHRVMTNRKVERFSVAYFFCPSYETVISSTCKDGKSPKYREFSFREFRRQVQEDVSTVGYKVGLPRFLL